MHRYLRSVGAAGILGSVILGLGALGCASRLDPVRASQTKGGVGRPNLPDIVLERGSECVAVHGLQLEPGRHVFDTTVEVYEDGSKKGVTIDDIPNSAYDFGACWRNVFREMPIAEEPFRQGVETLKYRREQAMAAQRSFVGSPVLVVAGVTIVVTELMLEAGAYTFLFAVTVEVVDKAAKDVAELAKRGFKKCLSHYTACMATGLSNPFKGNHWTASHCNGCFERCQTDGVWPGAVGGKTCTYW